MPRAIQLSKVLRLVLALSVAFSAVLCLAVLAHDAQYWWLESCLHEPTQEDFSCRLAINYFYFYREFYVLLLVLALSLGAWLGTRGKA